MFRYFNILFCGLCVICLLDTNVSRATVDEPTETLRCGHVGPYEPSIRWGPDAPREGTHLWACLKLPAAYILNLIRYGTGGMRPLAAVANFSSIRDNFVHFSAFTLLVTSDLSTCAGARRRRARRPSTRRCRPGTRAVT